MKRHKNQEDWTCKAIQIVLGTIMMGWIVVVMWGVLSSTIEKRSKIN